VSGLRVRALMRKELIEVARNRAALLPVVIVGVLSLVLPFVIAVVIPTVTSRPLGSDPDLVAVSRTASSGRLLSADGRVQAFFFQQFLVVFLLVPITGAMALASHAVIGEKLARTLEPLLASPVTTSELLVAKVLGAFVPTVLITVVGLLLYGAAIGLLGEPGVLRATCTARSAVLVAVVGPSATLVALQTAIVISSRVNDPRTAQQFAVLIIVPLIGLLIAQFTGTLWLSSATLALIGLGLFGLWAVLVMVSVPLFDRESILTRWR
jgi:ABC-2 type transport system permease protein